MALTRSRVGLSMAWHDTVAVQLQTSADQLQLQCRAEHLVTQVPGGAKRAVVEGDSCSTGADQLQLQCRAEHLVTQVPGGAKRAV
eukprot:1180271-Prorocentrum_minimum.AAC.2